MNLPHSLRARGHDNPLALGPGPIALTWDAEGAGPWRVQASMTGEYDINHLVWESPWHDSPAMIFDGAFPEPGHRIHWRVGQKSGDHIDWSESAYFEAAPPLEEWRAEWIFGGSMRHEFDIPGVPLSGRLSALTPSDSTIMINGEILAILKSDTMRVFDVSGWLSEGFNEIVLDSGSWIAIQLDGRMDTTLDFGAHTSLDWLPEGGECRPVAVTDIRLQ